MVEDSVAVSAVAAGDGAVAGVGGIRVTRMAVDTAIPTPTAIHIIPTELGLPSPATPERDSTVEWIFGLPTAVAQGKARRAVICAR
jgi:hypothetical protein